MNNKRPTRPIDAKEPLPYPGAAFVFGRRDNPREKKKERREMDDGDGGEEK